MDKELTQRILRIYTAIDDLDELNFENLEPWIIRTSEHNIIRQDFRGSLSGQQIANLAHSCIANIASLKDHLRSWAAHNGQSKEEVDDTLDNSLDLQIITDLWNREKHGHPRDAGLTGESPQLVGIKRVLRMTTGSNTGDSIALTLGPDGRPRVMGSGSAVVVITGDVIDGNGTMIGDLRRIATDAMAAWEGLMKEFGI